MTALASSCRSDSVQVDFWFKRSSTDPAAELEAQASSGIDVLGYLGHGSMWGWSSDPVLLNSTLAGGWVNPRGFVLLSWTCFDGAFVGPWGDSLAWSLVRNPRGGALLATAATTLEEPRLLEELAEELLCRLTSGGASRFGDALREAKAALAGRSPELTDLLLTYALLGDPTLPNPWR